MGPSSPPDEDVVWAAPEEVAPPPPPRSDDRSPPRPSPDSELGGGEAWLDPPLAVVLCACDGCSEALVWPVPPVVRVRTVVITMVPPAGAAEDDAAVVPAAEDCGAEFMLAAALLEGEA